MRNALLIVTGVLTALAASSAAPLDAPSPTAEAPQPPQDRPQPNRSDFTPQAREAVERGLSWLASRQNPNGSWTNRVGYKLYEDYFGEEHDSIDVTAIACMALVSGGHVPGRGKYGKNVALGVQWLLSKVRDEDGYVTHAGSRMYSHAFATLFLAEIYGMTRQPDIKPKLKRAVDLIVNSQNREGGWRYQPIPVDADLSVTVSTVQALRAARNVGISVPLDTIQRAMRYVLRCAVPRRGFSYQAATYDNGMNDTRVSFALTACGMVAMYSAGMYDSREIREGLRVLPNYKHSLIPGKLHYYYGHYYAAQAMYLAGGEHWAGYYPAVRDEILSRQEPSGHWEDDVGKAYATAMACVILQMPCEYLPIFQK